MRKMSGGIIYRERAKIDMSRYFPPHQNTILVATGGRKTSRRVSEFLLPRRHSVALRRALRRTVRKEHIFLAVGVQQSAQLRLQLGSGTARGSRNRPSLGNRNQTWTLRWQRGWQCLLRTQNPIYCKIANKNIIPALQNRHYNSCYFIQKCMIIIG